MVYHDKTLIDYSCYINPIRTDQVKPHWLYLGVHIDPIQFLPVIHQDHLLHYDLILLPRFALILCYHFCRLESPIVNRDLKADFLE